MECCIRNCVPQKIPSFDCAQNEKNVFATCMNEKLPLPVKDLPICSSL